MINDNLFYVFKKNLKRSNENKTSNMCRNEIEKLNKCLNILPLFNIKKKERKNTI